MISDPALVAAAKFEMESRERNYPKLVASGKMGADEATIDFQAWHCIVRWLETDRFKGIDAGGVDGRTIVSWALAEAAAERAVKSTAEALKGAEGSEGNDAKVRRLQWRLGDLRLIYRKVSRQRALLESLTKQLRERSLADRAERKAA